MEEQLPLRLIQSEIIPPAPTSSAAVDYLPDYAGNSWIAYAASNLLVISHFPASPHQTLIGPVLRQVIELSDTVEAVAWSPVQGDLAASVRNCIALFTHSDCSFSWRQTAVLVQSTNVETITWTDSGDGIISGGAEVVLWRLKSKSWEVAWKFKPELPQNLIAATFSIQGPLATAHMSTFDTTESSATEASKNVNLCYGDDDISYANSQLKHPMPVCMIQWRPLTGRQCRQGYSKSVRQILLTCCLDGTVRLWCEINDVKVKRTGKDVHDRKNTKRYYHVVATIEINQTLKGSLGADVFVRWATEVDDIITAGKTAEYSFPPVSSSGPEKTGRCEWLIAVGPNSLVTMWAVHCLDDVSPLRFPRVTLWLRRELSNSKYKIQGSLLDKVRILRSELSGAPNLCSLVQLLPGNSLVWYQLYTPQSTNDQEEVPRDKFGKEKSLSGYASGILNVDGHTGKVLQVAVHRYRVEIDLAASLDADGSVFLWSFPTHSSSFVGMATVYPTPKLCGKIVTQVSLPRYSSMVWAPSFSDKDTFIFMGHDQGIDCILIKILGNEEENVSCHKLCTIAFSSCSSKKGSTNLYSVPLPSNIQESFRLNNFLLLAIWGKGFQALSWKISIRSTTLDEIIQDCNHDSTVFQSDFLGIRYFITVDSFSSLIPDPLNEDEVTSFSTVSPNISVLSEEINSASTNELHQNYSGYHMVTGYNNGNLKLWRSTSNLSSEWELVGMLATHHGSIVSISISDCGRKISTLCSEGNPNISSTVYIWECVHVGGSGCFILEDILVFDGEVVALNWLTLGSGQQILGVCLQHELRVYAERRNDSPLRIKKGDSLGGDVWFCISFAKTNLAICGFVWGPRAMAVILCDRYFSVFSQWSFLAGDEYQYEGYSGITKDNFLSFKDGSVGCMQSDIFIGNNDFCSEGSSGKDDGHEGKLPMKLNSPNGMIPISILAMALEKCDSSYKTAFYSLQEIVENLQGPLAAYNPKALLTNIYSGHWKRAYVSLKHLVEYSNSNSCFPTEKSPTKSAHIIPLVPLSTYIEGVLSTHGSQISESSSFVTSSFQINGTANPFAFSWGSDAPSNSSTAAEFKLNDCIGAVEMLHSKEAINNTERTQILTILDLLTEIRNPTSAYESLDEPGRRFWAAVRFQQLLCSGKYISSNPRDVIFGSELFAWAFHSDCQENLLTTLLPNEPSWEEMRNVGVGFWYTNASQLRLKMEKLARQLYLKNKDPKACALLYVALNRLQVLAGLFKLSKDEKDKPLVAFLSRNFKEDKNKAAALKNAYVLMGRHQLELASAFFLLGGDVSSAVTVCAKNLGDEQLALVICRLVEGYSGPLERQLISKHLLPSAVEKGNCWMESFLEWVLGNYAQSFLCMLGVGVRSTGSSSVLMCNRASLSDPSIGQYCQMLATKNSFKNAVGEYNTAALGRWAIWVHSTALDKCGLPVDALERLSSSLGTSDGSDQGKVSDIGKLEVPDFLVPSPNNSSCNWINSDVAHCVETHAKNLLAMKYISKLVSEHPSWPGSSVAAVGARIHLEHESEQYDILIANFQSKLMAGLLCLEQKFNMSPLNLINAIVCALSSNRLLFIGHHIIHEYASQTSSLEKEPRPDNSLLYSINSKLISSTIEEVSCLLSRFIIASSMTCSQPKSLSNNHGIAAVSRPGWLGVWEFYVQSLQWSIWRLRTIMKLFGSQTKELTRISNACLDLSEYCIYFGLAWLRRNFRSLNIIMKSTLSYANEHDADGNSNIDLKKLLHSVEKSLTDNALSETTRVAVGLEGDVAHDQARTLLPADLRWNVVWAASWRNIYCVLQRQLKSVSGEFEDNYSLGPFDGLSFSMSGSDLTEPNSNNMDKQLKLVPFVLMKLLRTTCAQISSSCMKQFALFLVQNMDNEFKDYILAWLERSGELHSDPHQGLDKQEAIDVENNSSTFEILWDLFSDSKFIRDGLSQENIQWQRFLKPKPFKEWYEVHMTVAEEREAEGRCSGVSKDSSSFFSIESGSPVHGSSSPHRHSFSSFGQPKEMFTTKVITFQNPKEVYRMDGELLEALCVNSIDRKQAALASNRKGIIYFNWDSELPPGDYCNYIWAEADWPQKGWAGSESTPLPACVSPGVGHGSKKGKHIGLAGATTGSSPLARPGKDLTGGGAFGVPGYAGMGASGLGWEIQENLKDFVDPPATVNNISTRAFSSHPSRPFFLAGSSNTHVHLWEFGKDKATATYGVLPAANVPPPYALSSISAVQFDRCGQRFASAALDGSLCTWQLEVGGRSNVHPTESSVCFNNHASDVTYVTASGSIIAAAGYSSSGINVVIWDTLAPPNTSRASIMCHEGGAHSLAVFDNDIGSGSISPFIVTGGKGGDVGLHDFRYIATGKTKKHKSDGNASFISAADSRNGDRNRDGMLWYIPKAHSGSITKICTIPNSSLFLTGSKDGDVKLWDAKTAKLVSHWPRLHDKHTFLQPSSRGFREVVRAAVTDIQVISRGFLSCGGDGSVKLVQLKGSM